MKYFLLFSFFLVSLSLAAQGNADQQIRKLLTEQEAAWNRGDIAAFMKGYWESDSLMFIGSKGVTYGYKATYNRYMTTYDSPEKMGQLKFTLLHVNPLSKNVYQVVGKWQLTRTVGDIGGYYTLLFKFIGGRWVIICDHTS